MVKVDLPHVNCETSIPDTYERTLLDLLKSTAEKLRGTVGVPCPELWLELPVSVLPL